MNCAAAIVERVVSKFAEEDARVEALAAAARRERDAWDDANKRRVAVPEGDGLLLVPALGDAAVDRAMFEAVDTCAAEHAVGGVGLECLTAQSKLFAMRTGLKQPAAQEALLDFIGNLGAGFGF